MGLLKGIEDGLQRCTHAKTAWLLPKYALGFPLLEIQLDEKSLGLTAYDVALKMKEGKPAIHVGERKVMEGSILIHPANLDDASADSLVGRLRSVLGCPA